MTPAELRSRLESLDLTVNQFAELVHVTPWAVRKWLCDGKSGRKVPGPVIAWLDLTAKIMFSAQKIGKTNLHAELDKLRAD